MISKRRIKQLIELSIAKNITIAGAESCTGGLVSSLITMIPGSSSAFLGSVVSYANSAKAEILGVPKDILASHGAVSEACARAMALGAQRLFAADLVFSITGIAGPSGGTDEKPVGTVWFSLQYKNESRAWVRHFPGWRRRIQKLAAAEILGNMLAMLQNLT